MAANYLRNTFSMRIGDAHLRSVEPERQLAMVLGTLTEGDAIDPIIHELMHHVSANSIVNVALQYQWLALVRSSLSSPTFGIDRASLEMAGHVVAIEALMQPVAEGLALFAEFDCVVAAPVNPTLTMYDAVALRMLSLRAGMSDSLADLHQASIDGKLSPGQVARRADILAHPAHPKTANDTYLVGYITIKTAWNAYVAAGGRLPPGNFLEYLHYWLYEDWRLAELLTRSPHEGTGGIADHICARIKQLLAADIVARVDSFRRDKAQREARGLLPRGPEERQHGSFAGLGVTAEDVRDAHLALGRFYLERVAPTAPLNTDQQLNIVNVVNLTHEVLVMPVSENEEGVAAYRQRNPIAGEVTVRVIDFLLEIPQLKRALGLLIDIPVEMEVSGSSLTALRVRGSPWHAFPWQAVTAQDRPGIYPARLLGLVSSETLPWTFHCFVMVGERVQAQWTRSPSDPDLRQVRHVAWVLGHEQAISTATDIELKELAEMTSSRVLGDKRIEEAADAATGLICGRLEKLLSDHGWAPLFAAAPNRVDGGMRNLLTGRMVTALSIIGLVNSYSYELPEVARRLAAAGYGLDDVALIGQVQSQYGLALLAVDATTVHALI